jgi:hypothetical protein
MKSLLIAWYYYRKIFAPSLKRMYAARVVYMLKQLHILQDEKIALLKNYNYNNKIWIILFFVFIYKLSLIYFLIWKNKSARNRDLQYFWYARTNYFASYLKCCLIIHLWHSLTLIITILQNFSTAPIFICMK